MSKQLIQQYRANVERLIRYSGSRNESVLRKAFQELLDHYARSKNLLLVPEVEFLTRRGHKVYPDGTLKDSLRQNWGFWESKDEKDNLEDEIASKFSKDYPNFNILFEDTQNAILYQNGEWAMTASFDDDIAFDEILTLFVSYEPREVKEFHKAIEQFSEDVPELAKTLREIIDEQLDKNPVFKESLSNFLELCKKSINPNVEMADVREMIIQHILTEDIFMRVFDEPDFHRDNVIAHNLQEIARTFYIGATKRNIDARIAHYYDTINAKAAQISDHHEKQKFLKALYENFYKAYNPKAADRLGVIYTPDEIVHFIIESTDYLLYKHFGKTLGEPYVEILDPATGTGTFITELIDYLPLANLEQKYESEIHCNEVAILPYYIANLNIEFTYKQKTGHYKEFENICFVDTLDNLGFSRNYTHQLDMFGVWDENAERIGKQNSRKISVIIGNPPYNANQLNENENNKNREYPEIDKRIKDTYIKNSDAQKSKVYDMYSRFYRWASDRIHEKGIIAFITNRSFLDSRTFDGFRKIVSDEFGYIYIVDLGGDIRKNPKLSGPTHNVFAIQTGVAISFFIKAPKGKKEKAKIFYTRRPEFETAKEKLIFLNSSPIKDINFEQIKPDKYNNWLNIPQNDWSDLLPVYIKENKKGVSRNNQHSLFTNYSLGISTNRDEWVYDFDENNLRGKVKHFINIYNSDVQRYKASIGKSISDFINREIKWTSTLESNLKQGKNLVFDSKNVISALYRPFTEMHLYFDKSIIDRPAKQIDIFPIDKSDNNILIAISGINNPKGFSALAANNLVDLHFNGDSRCLSLVYYNDNGEKVDNITDWALALFQKKYKDKNINKMDIFNYVYAIFHNPNYIEKYSINLSIEPPRIPLNSDFWTWSNLGNQLIDLHTNFSTIPPYLLKRINKEKKSQNDVVIPKLKANKTNGIIEIDSLTSLSGIPEEAWDYSIGIYSAIEWVLERYKEKKPKDPTIREKFNTYKFADYKEQVIDLVARVCTVSVETMKIINQMAELDE